MSVRPPPILIGETRASTYDLIAECIVKLFLGETLGDGQPKRVGESLYLLYVTVLPPPRIEIGDGLVGDLYLESFGD
jgi:hypothetical protein